MFCTSSFLLCLTICTVRVILVVLSVEPLALVIPTASIQHLLEKLVCSRSRN